MIAATISGSRSDAEDIVQQAMTIALQKDNQFESESHFIGWLAGIVRHCALNYRRKVSRRNTYATNPQEMSVENVAAHQRPIDNTTGELTPLQSAFDDQVQNALKSISHEARCCLLLRTIEELSYREISELMGMPEGTAMNLVHRSKKKLREILSNRSVSHDTGGEGECQP